MTHLSDSIPQWIFLLSQIPALLFCGFWASAYGNYIRVAISFMGLFFVQMYWVKCGPGLTTGHRAWVSITVFVLAGICLAMFAYWSSRSADSRRETTAHAGQ